MLFVCGWEAQKCRKMSDVLSIWPPFTWIQQHWAATWRELMKPYNLKMPFQHLNRRNSSILASQKLKKKRWEHNWQNKSSVLILQEGNGPYEQHYEHDATSETAPQREASMNSMWATNDWKARIHWQVVMQPCSQKQVQVSGFTTGIGVFMAALLNSSSTKLRNKRKEVGYLSLVSEK